VKRLNFRLSVEEDKLPQRKTITWEFDRPLYNDHNAMKKLLQSGEILEEVEKVVGELG
jgi:hypothetical protein